MQLRSHRQAGTEVGVVEMEAEVSHDILIVSRQLHPEHGVLDLPQLLQEADKQEAVRMLLVLQEEGMEQVELVEDLVAARALKRSLLPLVTVGHSSDKGSDGVQHVELCPEELDSMGAEDVVSGQEQVDSRRRGLLQHGHLVLVIRAPDEDRVHCGLPYGGVLGARLSPCLQPALVLLAETAQGPQLALFF